MKEKICAGLGMLGGMLAAALGGWDTGLRVLLCLMAADFCTAGECGSVSPFSENRRRQAGQPALFPGRVPQGGDAGICGRCPCHGSASGKHLSAQCCSDRVLCQRGHFADGNAGCMGLPLPAAWKNAVSLLNRKSETDPQEKE